MAPLRNRYTPIVHAWRQYEVTIHKADWRNRLRFAWVFLTMAWEVLTEPGPERPA